MNKDETLAGNDFKFWKLNIFISDNRVILVAFFGIIFKVNQLSMHIMTTVLTKIQSKLRDIQRRIEDYVI